MSHQLTISGETKEERYAQLLPQIEAMIRYESDSIALMANVSAAIKEAFGFLWVGFYRVMGGNLVLGPFQGPTACTRIPYGKGVCGTAWAARQAVVVENVDLFPGHIACSSQSRSEIVVPFYRNGEVAGVLDIDSAQTAAFDSVDLRWLTEMVNCIDW